METNITTTQKLSEEEISQIKILEIIHLLGNWCSGGVLSIFGILIYNAIQSNVSPNVRKVGYNIINFNLSFIIYFIISAILCLVIIWFFMLGFFGIAWVILMIIGAIKHFSGEDYTYPMTIQFLK